MSKRRPFSTTEASRNLVEAMEDAIRNMTEEVKKVPDQELTGAARKSELSAIKETALACKELILERQKLIELMEALEERGSLEAKQDFGATFAEKFAKG